MSLDTATSAPTAETSTSVPSAHASQSVPPASSSPSNQEITDLVSAFEAHDFGADTEFRNGLPAVIKAIKGKGSSAAQIDEVIGRAQWFYFTRLKGVNVPFETYLRARTRETESQPMKSPTVAMKPLEEVEVDAQVLPATEAYDLPPPLPSVAAVNSAEVRIAEAAAVAGEPVTAAACGEPIPSASHQPPPENMKFTDIVRLIAEGRADEVPVPTIPDGINEEAPSVSTLPARRKPWEREQTEVVEEAVSQSAQ